MRSFESPRPVVVTLELSVASVQVAATDRSETTVEVAPTDPGRRDDLLAAERTRVEFAEGHLAVRTPRTWRRYSWLSDGGSIDVRIGCPTGSALTVAGPVVRVWCTGRYGPVQAATALGDIGVEDARSVALKVSGLGDVTIGRVEHDARISTGSGAVRLTSAGGEVEVKNSNGGTWIGHVAGPTRVQAANGDIVVDIAAAEASAKTANGRVHLGRVERGEVVAESGCGRVEVGIAAGVAAWLDLQTGYGGQVHNGLDDTSPPEPGEPVVRVRAHSGAGDVSISRVDPRIGAGCAEAPR